MHTSSKNGEPRGYATLLVVLIITSIGLAVTVEHLTRTATEGIRAYATEESAEALAYADACAEIALLAIEGQEAFEGGDSKTFMYGSCVYSVTAAEQSVVVSTGTAGAVTRTVRLVADTQLVATETATSTVITGVYWTEVSQ